VPAGPVNTIPDVMEHPHTIFRQMRVGAEDGYGALGVQAKLSRTPGGARSGPPKFGSATRAVLSEAGISADEIETLVNDGVALVNRRK
jgi:crotonobetainyl-CoA:carnitine CoA-transferase CaiB-like acyl-CoA transferase